MGYYNKGIDMMMDEFVEHSIRYKKILNNIKSRECSTDVYERCVELINLIDENLLIHCAKYN